MNNVVNFLNFDPCIKAMPAMGNLFQTHSMFYRFHLLFILWLAACQSYPQNESPKTISYPVGTVQESLMMQSTILGHDVQYSVYLPPGYEASDRSYPVLYLLHGYTDDETAWVQKGEISKTADQGIAAGEVAPMVIVMPDGGVSFFVDDYLAKEKYETFFFQELMPAIEKAYRIRQEKKYRAVGGLSMGGYGAAIYAMHRPDLFSTCVALSSAFRTDEDMATMKPKKYNRIFNKLYGEGTGAERITAHWHQNSPNYLAQTLPAEQLKSIRWYIDCGDDDGLSPGNAMMHIILKERGIAHEYRMRNGKHDWHYWRTGMAEGLKFISESFRK